MNFLKKKLFDVATLTTATLATLSLATTNPAAAFLIGFCGIFDNGGTVDGVIDVGNDGSFDISKYARITTYEVGQTNKREYSGLDFIAPVDFNAIGSDSIGTLIPSYKYTFKYDSLTYPDNRFEVYLPASYFPISGILPQVQLNQIEYREGVRREDPDGVRPVPEPTSVLGTAIAISLGGLMTKRNLRKLKQDQDAA